MKSKILAIVLVLSLIVIVPCTALASDFKAYWGQDFPGEEEMLSKGEAVFFQETEYTNYEFALFKDGKQVYKNRIEEGYIDVGEWWFECIFLNRFCEFGSGRYTFSVSALTGDGNEIDDATVVKTATSGAFDYIKPSVSLSAPKVVSNKDGKLDWTFTDPKTDRYMCRVRVDYNGKKYDLDYDWVCEEEDASDISYKDYDRTLSVWENSNPEKYPKDKAILEINLIALPVDITEYNPSPETAWIAVEKGEASEPEGPVEVDRSAISESSPYYDSAKVLYDLGIMPEIYKNHEADLTRGDMAVIMTAFLGRCDEANENQKCRFSDVEQNTYLAGCINAVTSQGVVSGLSDGTFNSAGKVKYAEAVTALVKTLGYNNPAQSNGGYPLGYLSIASQHGITKGVNLSIYAEITMGQFSQLVFNSLDVGLCKQTSFGYNPQFDITDDTVLFQYLDMEKILANAEFPSKTEVKFTGFVRNAKNLSGFAVKDKIYKLNDADAVKYGIPNLAFFAKDGEILSAIPCMDAVLLLNGGSKTTTSQVVSANVMGFGYTKFKTSQNESYKPITDDAFYYFIDSTKHQEHTYRVYFANEDESETVTRKAEITFSNKHKMYLMLNGEHYKTLEYGYGEKINKPSKPSASDINGYVFRGWQDVPETMPDMDIVIHADIAPSVTVKGQVKYKGVPFTGGSVQSKSHDYTLANQGIFELTVGQDERMLRIVNSSLGIDRTIEIDLSKGGLDLGIIELDNVSVLVDGNAEAVSGLESVITQEDREFCQTEGNKVTVKASVEPITNNVKIAQELAEKFSDYGIAAMYDVNINKIKTSDSGETSVPVTEHSSFITLQLKIPVSQRGREDYVVIREHMEAIDVLTKTPNANGEFIEIQGDCVLIHCKKFSDYALVSKNKKIEKFEVSVERPSIESASIKIEIPQNTNDASLYIAKYGHNGELLGCEIKTDIQESYNLTLDSKTANVKAFVWNSLMQPLC